MRILLCTLMLVGCAEGPDAADDEVTPVVPFAYTVERVALTPRGWVVEASIEEGSPHLRVAVDSDLGEQEMGRGIANARHLTWTFTPTEIAWASTRAAYVRADGPKVRWESPLRVDIRVEYLGVDARPDRGRERPRRHTLENLRPFSSVRSDEGMEFRFSGLPPLPTLRAQAGQGVFESESFATDDDSDEARATILVPWQAMAETAFRRESMTIRTPNGTMSYGIAVSIEGVATEPEDENKEGTE